MSLRFAVFGDVHGRVPLMLLLTRAWQHAHDLPLDGILQVGDMGAFPDHTRLDKSTAKYARDDPDELDFAPFVTRSPLSESLLDHPDTPAVAFCRGNHEDFEYLGRYRVPTALDPFNKLWYVPDGQVLRWGEGADRLRVGAFGGAPPLREQPAGRGRRSRAARRKRQRRAVVGRWTLAPRFTREAAQDAFADVGGLDVLLTHGGPEDPAFPVGCPELAALVGRSRPRVHLFGHHHATVGPVRAEAGHLLVGLEHLEFLRDGSLRPGSWGVLELGEEARFQFVDARDHPWMTPFRRHRWRALLG